MDARAVTTLAKDEIELIEHFRSMSESDKAVALAMFMRLNHGELRGFSPQYSCVINYGNIATACLSCKPKEFMKGGEDDEE